MSLREDIFAIDDMKVEPFATPEWPSLDGKVYIRTITSREKGLVEKKTCDMKTGTVDRLDIFVAAYGVMFFSDADGKRIFGEDDIYLLAGKSSGVLERALRAWKTLSGQTDESLKELEKNFEGTITLDSSTPSPLPLE